MVSHEMRPGEIAADVDPSAVPGDATLVFIGEIHSPWRDPATCPKNLRDARSRGGSATLLLRAPWRPGLRGLEPGAHLILLYWMDRARRDLIVQHPRHREGPSGAFSLRSPLRPNPIAFAVVKLLALDPEAGRPGDRRDRLPRWDAAARPQALLPRVDIAPQEDVASSRGE